MYHCLSVQALNELILNTVQLYMFINKYISPQASPPMTAVTSMDLVPNPPFPQLPTLTLIPFRTGEPIISPPRPVFPVELKSLLTLIRVQPYPR